MNCTESPIQTSPQEFHMITAPEHMPSVIPNPRKMQTTPGAFELEAGATIAYTDVAAKQSAEMLAEQLRPATDFILPVLKNSQGDIVFQTQENPTLGKEGYALQVTDYVLISAPTAAGLFYGAQTLRQLLPPEIYSQKIIGRHWEIPAVEIWDSPRFGWRGIHLDVSRHFISKKHILRFIDILASLKFNIFHWHLTDDQGWRIEIRKYPKLTEIGAFRKQTQTGHFNDAPREYDRTPHGGFYTQDDIREVVAYALDRHITIIPEIDMPGHMQAAIAAYPELGCTPESIEVREEWGISKYILNPDLTTIQFCKDVLLEVMELFPSKFIHIGGDEAEKDFWEQSEHIQQLRTKRGLKNMYEMQSWFTQQINAFLAENGRRLIGWDEIAEGGLPEQTTIMWWRTKQGLTIARDAAQKGHDVIISSSSNLYFDHCQAERNEPLTIGHYLPLEQVYNFNPTIPGLDQESAKNILGVQGQLWTEYIPTIQQMEYMAFPRTCALAEIAWLPNDKKNYIDFLERAKIQEKRFDMMNTRYRPIRTS